MNNLANVVNGDGFFEDILMDAAENGWFLVETLVYISSLM